MMSYVFMSESFVGFLTGYRTTVETRNHDLRYDQYPENICILLPVQRLLKRLST